MKICHVRKKVSFFATLRFFFHSILSRKMPEKAALGPLNSRVAERCARWLFLFFSSVNFNSFCENNILSALDLVIALISRRTISPYAKGIRGRGKLGGCVTSGFDI